MKPIYNAFALPESEWNRYIPEYGMHWGEWSVPESQEPGTLDPATALIRPKQEVTCAYTHYSMRMLGEMLTAIGRQEEADQCLAFARGSKEAYHVHWIKNGTVHTDHMAELVRPIALGLADPEEKKNIAALLNEMTVKRNYKVGTGFLSTLTCCRPWQKTITQRQPTACLKMKRHPGGLPWPHRERQPSGRNIPVMTKMAVRFPDPLTTTHWAQHAVFCLTRCAASGSGVKTNSLSRPHPAGPCNGQRQVR